VKLLLILSIFLFCVTGRAVSATVSFSQWLNISVGTSTEVLLDQTFTGRIGIFTGSANSNSTFSDINPFFTSLDSALFRTSAGNEDGYIDLGVSPTYDGAIYGGQQIFVWYTDGSNQNALITGFGTFRSDLDIPTTSSHTIETANIGSLTIVTGSFNASGPSPYGGGMLRLNNIPEPSTFLLASLGVLGLLRRRR
jgi:hypothetical protein